MEFVVIISGIEVGNRLVWYLMGIIMNNANDRR